MYIVMYSVCGMYEDESYTDIVSRRFYIYEDVLSYIDDVVVPGLKDRERVLDTFEVTQTGNEIRYESEGHTFIFEIIDIDSFEAGI